MTFELGPIQQEWLRRLEEHPERQINAKLGELLGDGTYGACCLGEYLLTYHRDADIWEEKILVDDHEEGEEELVESYQKLGLRTQAGGFNLDRVVNNPNPRKHSLAMLNDHPGITWPQIARFIRENAEHIFTRSL